MIYALNEEILTTYFSLIVLGSHFKWLKEFVMQLNMAKAEV